MVDFVSVNRGIITEVIYPEGKRENNEPTETHTNK